MQPQSPYGPPQPYNSQGPANQPQGPNPPYPAPGYATPGAAYPRPGQAANGQPYPSSNSPGPLYPPQTPGQSVSPGQPPLPPYVPPQNLSNQPQPENLPPPPPAPTTPYDFFLDQPKPHAPANPLSPSGKKYGAATLAGGSRKSKFILLAGGGVVAVIILMIVTALLPKDPTASQWLAIAQRQQEIIRVCAQGSKAKYQATRNLAITCQTGVTTSQRELLAYMSKSNFDYDSKELELKKDTKTDTRLKSATSSSTFDDTFREIVETQLTSYNRSLTAQLSSTTGPNGREVLSKNQRSAELLLQMAKDDSDKTEAPASES